MQPPSNSPPPPSSGYSSAAEFFPMDADSSMNTDDYELCNPRMMAQHSHLRRRQGCQVSFELFSKYYHLLGHHVVKLMIKDLLPEGIGPKPQGKLPQKREQNLFIATRCPRLYNRPKFQNDEYEQKVLDQTWQPCPLQNALVLLLQGPHPLPVPAPTQQSPLPVPSLCDVPERDGDARPQGEAQEKRPGQQRTLRDVCAWLCSVNYRVVSRIESGNATYFCR